MIHFFRNLPKKEHRFSAVKQKIIDLSYSLLDNDTAYTIISFENIHKLNRAYGV